MILVTGGLGFIGSHTTRALIDAGQDCLITRHRTSCVPEHLERELGERLFVEQVDIDDRDALPAAGRGREITGVVHLADSGVERLFRRPGDSAPVVLEGLFDGLSNVLAAARQWGVRRVVIASTIGVYGGLPPGPMGEGLRLPPAAAHAIPTVKRCVELLAQFAATAFGLEVVCVRPSGIWGPGGRPASVFFALPQLVHGAARGARVEGVVYGDDGIDLCYVKDCARAIAAVQLAPTLNHSIYNVGSGQVTTNAQVLAAIERLAGPVDVELVEVRGASGAGEGQYLDIGRLQQDTGYLPSHGLEAGIAEYLSWLNAGHDR